MMSKTTFRVLIVLLALACTQAAAQQAAPQVTAIRAGRLVVPETGAVLTNQIIVVEGARIKAVGSDVQIPQGAKVIDLSRRTVLPGLFACHEHMAFLINAKGQERGSLFFYDLTHTSSMRAIHGVINSRDIPPRDILLMMTTNAARLLGVEKVRGSVAAGQFADIIAVPENPLDDISTLKRVNFVMKNGKVFKQTD